MLVITMVFTFLNILNIDVYLVLYSTEKHFSKNFNIPILNIKLIFYKK